MLLSTESLDARLVLGRFSVPKRLRVESFLRANSLQSLARTTLRYIINAPRVQLLRLYNEQMVVAGEWFTNRDAHPLPTR
jgi:hypothetical protein